MSDMQDFSARFKKVKGSQEAAQARPMDFTESYRIRAKMLGVLIRDARQSAARTVEDCARLLRVSPQEVEAWEYGDQSPSLPQLEILAYYLGVPVSHFWGMETITTDGEDNVAKAQAEYMALRQRVIGALMRIAREEAGVTLEDLSASSGIPVEYINAYELGEAPIPLHQLSVLASGVRKNMSYFLESGGHIGELLIMRQQWKHFSDMPDDVREFVSKPINIGFLHIAQAFSQMPTENLRQIGESLLNDITL
jgi:transcriptional regulator with XRE-family HTH domain